MKYLVEIDVTDMWDVSNTQHYELEVEARTSEDAAGEAMTQLHEEHPELYPLQASFSTLVHPPTGRGSYDWTLTEVEEEEREEDNDQYST